MSKKNSIILILVVVLFMIGWLLFSYFSSSNTTNTTTQTTQDLFGNTTVDKDTNTNTKKPITIQNTETTKNLNKLIQLYRNPTSGSVFFTNKNNQNVLRFVDRAVGNIYEYIPETQTGEVTRVTNTTIPKIQESVWSNSGDNLVLRYLNDDTDNIVSFSSKIVVSTSSPSSTEYFGAIVGSFLTTNMKQLVINPKGDKIFGLVDKSDKSGSFGFTTNLNNGGKKVIFDSPISYWNVSWPKENIITFTTKPNFRDMGLLYFFNTQTNSMDRILGNITGFSTLTNRDANLVAYSYSTNNSLSLDIYDVINKISKNIKVATLADKCVWGSSNDKILYCAVPKFIMSDNYPDSWYQGLESFSDNIWKIDSDTGVMTEIYQVGTNENADIDAFDLKISLDDKYLTFSDKNDLSLWLLELAK